MPNMTGHTGFLEAHFDKWIPEPNTGCWIWFASQTSAGYGNGTQDFKNFYAHRESFEDANGAGSADGWVIRHRCDTPWCINPDHLLSGTKKDNSADMVERGRKVTVRGENSGRATISQDLALEIRGMSSRHTATEIANRLGVDRSVVYNILNGISWRHLGGKVPCRKICAARPPVLRGEDANNVSLTKGAVREIKRRLANGERGCDLALMFGVSRANISAIKVGRIWGWL